MSTVWALLAALGWPALGFVVGSAIGRVTRRRDRQIPRGWHRYDRTCACAACERCEPSSPYLKVRGKS